MMVTVAIALGFLLDLWLGDPRIPHCPHPVVVMGRAISWLEPRLRRRFPDDPSGQVKAGAMLTAILCGGTFVLTGGVCWGIGALVPPVGFLFQVLWCWQALALKDLRQESIRVYRTLQEGDIADSRQAVGRIVGRDTAQLDRPGIIRATIETVAENFSDGVVAPLFYMLVGGAPLALTYKAANTLDSMVGYKNSAYIHFGRVSARLDDGANFLPSRMAAWLWIVAAGLDGQDFRGAWRCWRQDRRKHASPNSAQCEAACAGALGIQLAGPASYFGSVVDKPFIGEPHNAPVPSLIIAANRTLLVAGVLALGLGLALRCGLLWLISGVV